VPAPVASNANSDSGTVNCEMPQSRHTKTFGNTQTPGLFRFLEPENEKWMTISAVNSASVLDPHNRQGISATRGKPATQGGRKRFPVKKKLHKQLTDRRERGCREVGPENTLFTP